MKYLLQIAFLLLPLCIQAQDRQFSQFYSAPLLLNPALTGFNSDFRAGVNARSQWTGLKKSFNSASVYADFYIPSVKSGFGLLFNHESFGKSGFEANEISGTYSYSLPLAKSFNIRLGLEASYVSSGINFQKLLFEDQYNGSTPNGNPTEDPLVNTKKDQYFDFSSGILLYGEEKYWLGISFHHINKPTIGTGKTSYRIPVKHTITGGINFIINNSTSNHPLRLTPAFVYKKQGNFDQLDLGSFISKKDFLIGLFYRRILFKNLIEKQKSGLLSFQAGLKFQKLLFIYSYDFPITGKPISGIGPSHEISIIFKRKSTKNTLPF